MCRFLFQSLGGLCLALMLSVGMSPSAQAAEAEQAPGAASHGAGDHGPAAAHDDHDHAAAGHGDAHGADHGDGHAPAGPITAGKADRDLAVWSLIVFLVFVTVLRKFAWGPLTAALDAREASVLQNIADAESARLKAEKMLADHAEKLAHVQDEIRELMAEARRDAEHTKNDIIATAQREAEATQKRAITEIERARDQALDGLFAHMADAVADATEQVLGRAVTGTDQERLVQEALSGFTASRN